MANRSEARKQFLCDVFTVALEGGIQSWAYVNKYHWMLDRNSDEVTGNTDLDGFFAEIEVEEAGEGVDGTHRIDADVIARGLGLLRKGEVKYVGEEIRKAILEEDRTNDCGYIDAGCASAIVELGLFGEVVFC